MLVLGEKLAGIKSVQQTRGPPSEYKGQKQTGDAVSPPGNPPCVPLGPS